MSSNDFSWPVRLNINVAGWTTTETPGRLGMRASYVLGGPTLLTLLLATVGSRVSRGTVMDERTAVSLGFNGTVGPQMICSVVERVRLWSPSASYPPCAVIMASR
ncbi:hypothetical protein ACLOJK_010263 [Asimina triloba]